MHTHFKVPSSARAPLADYVPVHRATGRHVGAALSAFALGVIWGAILVWALL